MSGNKKYKSVRAKTDPEGWIKTRKDKYEFPPVQHSTRATILSRNAPNTACLPPVDEYGFAPTRHSSRASLSPKKTQHTPQLSDIKPIVTPHKTIRVKNPYKTQTKLSEDAVKRKPTIPESKPEPDNNGLPLEAIKKTHKLFFTYDPRGNMTKPLPKGYCEHCLCPVNYCAEIVFGEMSKNHALTKVYTSGTYHDKEDRGTMRAVFDEAYTEGVFSKLRWNGFDLNAIEVEESWKKVRIPLCMKKTSLRKFLKQIKQNNDEEYDIACQSYMYNEEEEIQEAIKNGDFNTTHPVMKRTAMEQSQDITLMFKKIKKVNAMKTTLLS